MNIDKYRLNRIEFDSDEWEFFHSLIHVRYDHPVNILSIGGGNYSLEYALATELENKIKTFFSIDLRNSHGKGDSEFFEKRTVYSTIIGRGCGNTVAIQNDCFDLGVKEEIVANLKDEEINLVILEFERSIDYIKKALDYFGDLFSSKYDIYMHHISKSEEGFECFEDLSSGNTSVLFRRTCGTGIIKDIKGPKRKRIGEEKNGINLITQ